MDVPNVLRPTTHLKHANVTYIPNDQGAKNFNDALDAANLPFNLQNVDTMMFTGPGHDRFCKGDSGGPLYDKEKKKLVGIVSFVFPGCPHDVVNGYARISNQVSNTFIHCIFRCIINQLVLLIIHVHLI